MQHLDHYIDKELLEQVHTKGAFSHAANRRGGWPAGKGSGEENKYQQRGKAGEQGRERAKRVPVEQQTAQHKACAGKPACSVRNVQAGKRAACKHVEKRFSQRELHGKDIAAGILQRGRKNGKEPQKRRRKADASRSLRIKKWPDHRQRQIHPDGGVEIPHVIPETAGEDVAEGKQQKPGGEGSGHKHALHQGIGKADGEQHQPKAPQAAPHLAIGTLPFWMELQEACDHKEHRNRPAEHGFPARRRKLQIGGDGGIVVDGAAQHVEKHHRKGRCNAQMIQIAFPFHPFHLRRVMYAAFYCNKPFQACQER